MILDRLPDPPKLVGALAPNTELQKAEKLFLKQVDGPEATVFDHGMLTLCHVYDHGVLIHALEVYDPSCPRSCLLVFEYR